MAKTVPGFCSLLFLLLATSIPSLLKGQSVSFEQASLLFGKQRSLSFRPYTLDLDDKSRESLLEIVELARVSPVLFQKNLLVLQIFTCEKELKVKPYLGVCRGQVVIDFLEKEIGMPRKKCLIRDGGANPLDPDCLAGSGVLLYLKPDWGR
jgi:hypothetical protein